MTNIFEEKYLKMKNKTTHFFIAFIIYSLVYALGMLFFTEAVQNSVFWSQIFIFGIIMALSEIFVFDKLRKKKEIK